MKLDELNKLLEEKTEDVFRPDRKDWVEQLCVCGKDEDGNFSDYYATTTDIFVCKEGENSWTPKIYWVKVSRKNFNSMLETIDKDDNFIMILEWGNDSGMDNMELTVRSVTEYYVYLAPLNWKEYVDAD